MPSLSPKSVSSNKIFSGKADLSTPCMMPKPVFVEEVDDDDDDTDFEPVFRIRIVSAGDNQTHQSVMSYRINGPPGKQELLEAQSLKEKQLDEWLHCHSCGGLNVMWYEDVLDKPCVDLIGCLGILGRYFYTNLFICKIYLLLLAVCCHLKSDCLKDTHNHFCTIWTNGLAYSDLIVFAKDHKDWFLSFSPPNLGE